MQWSQWYSETSVGLVRHTHAVEAIVGVLYSMYMYMCVSVFVCVCV